MRLSSYFQFLVGFAQFILALQFGNYLDDMEKAFQQQNGDAINLNDEFLSGLDSPKEIEIYCPGDDPTVSIRELTASESNENAYGGNDCLHVKISGTKFSFAFSLKCP